jgi:hypothetical protein
LSRNIETQSSNIIIVIGSEDVPQGGPDDGLVRVAERREAPGDVRSDPSASLHPRPLAASPLRRASLRATREAHAALEDIGLYSKVQLVIAGGLRHGSDCGKALDLGADACYLGTALLIALNCKKPIDVDDDHAIGAAPYACHHGHTGRCPVGIATKDPRPDGPARLGRRR